MNKKINVEELPDFDLAEHLKTNEDIATYLSVVLEDDDSSELMHALGVVARARGMTEVARAAGLTREALYKALRPNSQPRFDTIARVCRALGLKLTTQCRFMFDAALKEQQGSCNATFSPLRKPSSVATATPPVPPQADRTRII